MQNLIVYYFLFIMQRPFVRGFTLIELLVVIAIIGILSAVVLGFLNGARTNGGDAAVKSNINSIRSQAELLYDPTGGAYSGICNDSIVTSAKSAAISAGGNGGNCTTNASGTLWAAWAGLKSLSNKAWCVDSTSAGYRIDKPGGAGNITVCPDRKSVV